MGGTIETVLEHSSPLNLAIATILALAVYWNGVWLVEEIKIRRLGGHTRRAPTWMPFGISLHLYCPH
jgi:hypothetical protein